MYHVKPKRNSLLTPRKRGQSRHHAMHYFHFITSIILLFHESRPDKRATHAITPTTGGTSSMMILERPWSIFSRIFFLNIGDPENTWQRFIVPDILYTSLYKCLPVNTTFSYTWSTGAPTNFHVLFNDH